MSSPAKHAREVVAAIRGDVGLVGATVEVGHNGGGHPHLVISLGGATRRLAFANTPRDADVALARTRSLVRRLLRSMEPRQ